MAEVTLEFIGERLEALTVEVRRLSGEVAQLRNEMDGQFSLMTAKSRDVAQALMAERERCAALAQGWKSPLRPGTEARLLGHQEAARDIAAAIRQMREGGGTA